MDFFVSPWLLVKSVKANDVGEIYFLLLAQVDANFK